MDNEQVSNDDEQAMKETSHYIWLAACLIGGTLILMLLVIVGIILWKYLKKPTTADQNWAGPSPLAEGNNQNFSMNECILGNMQPSSIETSKDGDLGENTVERNPTDAAPSNMLSMPPTMPMSQFSKEYPRENHSNDETFPPPPPEICQEFPPPTPSDSLPLPDLEEYPLQPLPLPSPPSDEGGTLLTSNEQGSPISENINGNIFDDMLLPPPPDGF